MISQKLRQYDVEHVQGGGGTHARTDGGIIHSKPSPLERGMRISISRATHLLNGLVLLMAGCSWVATGISVLALEVIITSISEIRLHRDSTLCVYADSVPA